MTLEIFKHDTKRDPQFWATIVICVFFNVKRILQLKENIARYHTYSLLCAFTSGQVSLLCSISWSLRFALTFGQTEHHTVLLTGWHSSEHLDIPGYFRRTSLRIYKSAPILMAEELDMSRLFSMSYYFIKRRIVLQWIWNKLHLIPSLKLENVIMMFKNKSNYFA